MIAINNSTNRNSSDTKAKASKTARAAIVARLRGASYASSRLDATSNRLKKLQSLMENSDGLDKNITKEVDDVLAGAKNDLNSQILEMVRVSDEVNKLISYVPDERMRTILERRYIDCKSMEDISKELHCTSRNLYNLHNKALDYIVGYMNNENS